MGIFKQFATNRELEKNGTPLKFAPNPDGTVPTIFVKRTYRDDPKYQAAFTRITKPYKAEIDSGEIDPALDAQLMQQLCADQSVASWVNMRLPVGVGGIGRGEGPENTWIANDDGTVPIAVGDYDIPFTVDNCARLFRVLPDAWRRVVATAADPDAYKQGELEEMAKNW